MKLFYTLIMIFSALTAMGQIKNINDLKVEALGTARAMDNMDGEISTKLLERKLLTNKPSNKIQLESAKTNDKLVFDLCITRSGKVISATILTEKSSISNKATIEKARKKALLLEFEPKPNGKSKECGLFEIRAGK